jgi:glycosyltransferase involved in cell wall biosynthesis
VPAGIVDSFLKSEGIQQPTHLVHDFSYGDRVEAAVAEGPGRDELGVPTDAFVVLGCGTVEWRKGVDLFLQIAAKLLPGNPDMYFVWAGGPVGEDTMEYDRILFDRERLGFTKQIIFPGFVPQLRSLYAACDVFALTSREDPFPLVCLEAARAEKPILCFDKAGGMPEFVEDDAGAVIPYGDIDAFCSAIARFRDDPSAKKVAGRAAAEKLGSRFSADISCEMISGILSGSRDREQSK